MDDATSSPLSRPPATGVRRPWRRRGCLAVVVLAAVLVAWTAAALLSARSDLQRAQQRLTAVRDHTDGLSVPQTQQALHSARSDLSAAAGQLRQFGPRVVGVLPLVGRVVTASRTVADAGVAVTAAGESVLSAVTATGTDAQALGSGATHAGLYHDGGLDLGRLGEVQRALAAAARSTGPPIDALQQTQRQRLPGPLRHGVDEALSVLGGVPGGLREGADALSGLSGVLGGAGRRTVAVVLFNNAEQRGAGGVVSVFALGTADSGRLTLDSFRDVYDLADPPGTARRVPSPPDYHRLWGPYLADTTIWRNVGMSPDGPSTLDVTAGVAAATTDRRPDVVIGLDVRAIAAILEVTGPVELPDGTQLTSANAVRQLLLTAYTRFPDNAVGQGQRRQVLRVAANGVLMRLLNGDVPALPTVRALRTAVGGRHLIVWSARPTEQAQLVAAGVSGALRADGGDLASVATQNFGQSRTEGNKLDFFVRRLQRIDVVVGQQQARITQSFALRNIAPTHGLPGYVLGYSRPGELDTFVTQALPRDAVIEQVRRDGLPLPTTTQPQGDHVVTSDSTTVKPGQTTTWTLTYRVPLDHGHYLLTAVPQPLAVDAGLAVTVRAAEGLQLATPPGSPLDRQQDDSVSWSGAFSDPARFAVNAERPGWWSRSATSLRRFLNDPVQLP